MRKVKLRSGGSVNVLDKFDLPVSGEVNFTSEELEWAKRLSNDLRDPESQRSFWATVLEKKADVNYNLFTDFPKKDEPETVASKYCTEIINSLKGRR